MNTIASTALSGINAAQTRLDSAAHNIANVNTQGFKRQEVVQKEQVGGGVTTGLTKAEIEGAALEADMVNQLQAKNAYLINLQVFKTIDKMAGTLLDTSA